MFQIDFSILFTVFYMIFSIEISTQETGNVENDFSAVTNFEGLNQLYENTKKKDPRTTQDTTTDRETKKLICESFGRSGYSRDLGQIPVNMDKIYNELKKDAITDEEKDDFKQVMRDYKRNMFSTLFSFSSKSITFKTKSADEEEFAFPCVTEYDRLGKLKLFYISNSYRLDIPGDEEFRVRFGCSMLSSTCYLSRLAEVPSTAFASPEFSINDVYLQMRKFYNSSQEPAHDPVCKLDKPTKLRVCTSVLSSSHFAKKIIYLPIMDSFNEECKSRDVPVSGDEAADMGEPYKEWMLSCSVKRFTKEAHSTYFISRAYQSHYAIVYTEDESTKKMRIENISGHIAPIIERDMTICEGCENLPPPILANMLKEARQTTDGLTQT